MLSKKWLSLLLVILTLGYLMVLVLPSEAWARVGSSRGGFMGSRGFRSAAPPRPYVAPQPSRPYTPTTPGQTRRPGMTPAPTPTPSASSPSSFWRSFGGGLLGGLAGGLLFRSLFGGAPAYGGAGGGFGGGIGLFDILILAGIGYLIYWYLKKKRLEAAAEGPYYQSRLETLEPPQQPTYQQPPYYDQLPLQADDDLEKGLGYIRQTDPGFDETRFNDQVMDMFFKVQGAYANRDLSPVKHLLTEEMYRLLQEDAAQLKAEGRTNRLENIAVREVNITEAWQEAGQDYITARVYANLLDYTVDDKTGEVISGSKIDPVKFEEYWTFTRPLGNNPWQLSAIQQAP